MSQGVQWAVLVPVVLLLVLGGIQVALLLQARSCVQNAALAAAQSAAVYGDAGNGVSAAQAVVRGGALSNVSINSSIGVGSDGVERVNVTVSGDIPRIVPLGPGRVAATATLPKEQ